MGTSSVAFLQKRHRIRQKAIQGRLRDFKRFFREPVIWTYANNRVALSPSSLPSHQRLFEELCFCILAANTSAEMGMKTIEHIRHLLHTSSSDEMTRALRGTYRFINLRPQYIAHTREYLGILEEPLHELLQSFSDARDLRDFLADNSGIKGISFKEASHFLRNTGFEGFAILDKHILHSMEEAGVIEDAIAPSTRKNYLALEEKYLEFAGELKINPNELDLLLWSEKTGKILK